MAGKRKVILNFFNFVLSLPAYSLYCFLWEIAGVFNKAYGKLFAGPMNEAKLGRIVWKKRLSFLHNSIPRDFLYLNFTNVSPKYVLRPNVSLYAITKTEAIFVEHPTDVNIYSSDAFPFFFAAQFIHSTNVIKMSIECFDNLAEEIGDPSVPVMWLSNTGRCGSTMISQVFESVEGTLVMAEPDVVQSVFYMLHYDNLPLNDCRKMLKSTVRLLCKPRPGVERIFIKLRSSCTALMTDMSQIFPEIRQMFMYRNCYDVVTSFAEALISIPYCLVLRKCSDNELLSKVLPVFRELLRFHIGTKRKSAPEVPLNVNTFGLLTYMWAEQMLVARDAISRDKNILVIRYEHIVSEPREVIKTIFENLNIDLKHLNKALSSLDKDSQRGTEISRSRVGKNRKIDLADRVTMDEILTSYNLPKIGEGVIL